MTDYEKFLEKMRELSDEKLKEVVSVTFEDYTDVALEAARAVLEERGIQLQIHEAMAQGDQREIVQVRTFKECLDVVDVQGTLDKIQKLFNETDDQKDAYKRVLLSLKSLKVTPNTQNIVLFVAQIREDVRAGYLFDVFGVEKGQEEYFGLEMFTWSEWLGFEIYDKTKAFILNFGMDEFVAVCLKKMTSLGMTEEEIAQRISEMEALGDDFFNQDDSDSDEKIMV